MKTGSRPENARSTFVRCCNEDAITIATPKQTGTASKPGMVEDASSSRKLEKIAATPTSAANSASVRDHSGVRAARTSASVQPNSSSHAREGSMKKAHSGLTIAILTAIASDRAMTPTTAVNKYRRGSRGASSIRISGQVR